MIETGGVERTIGEAHNSAAPSEEESAEGAAIGLAVGTTSWFGTQVVAEVMLLQMSMLSP